MAKPAIVLHAPPVLFLGGEHQIEFELTAEADTKVDYIEARVLGKQGWEIGSGKSRISHDVIFPRVSMRLMEKGVLPAGSTRFAMKFWLPPNAAPSHQIDPAYARMEVLLRIGVPWWFDTKFNFVLPVRMPPPPFVQRTPVAIRSTPASAPADQPRIELALASTRLVAGEVVGGSCAVFHLDDRKPRHVELSLVPVLQLFGRGRPRERWGTGITMQLTMPVGSAGSSIPFEILLPAWMPPSFDTTTHKLSWRLYAKSGSFFGGKVEVGVPLEIVDRAAAATAGKVTQAPRLGDQRIAALFSAFAAQAGWHDPSASTDDDDDDDSHTRIAVERETGRSTLRLGYAYRDDGTFVTGRIHGPSLGLGLAVSPSSAIRHMFWKDIEVDIDAWDRAHHVTARFADQTIPALKAIVPSLQQAPQVGTLVRWTDDELAFERPIANVEIAELEVMGKALELISIALDGARALIGPPPGLAIDLDDWRGLAKQLDGELVPGDLSITGKLGHVPVELDLEFDDEQHPIAIRATVGNPDDASAAARAVTLALARPAADVLGASQADVAEALVDPLTRWPSDIVDLAITDGTATARLIVTPPTIEARRARELVQNLVGLLAALDPGAGPYR